MSEFKGTKGKWEVHDNGYFFDIQVKGTTLASTQNNLYLNIDEKVQLANAKLIARAPELLKALEHTLEILYKCDPPKELQETYGNLLTNYTNLTSEITSEITS